jgi:hypothetical protein
VRFDVGRVDHLHLGGSPPASKFTKQIFPDAAACPTSEAIVDRCVRPVGFGTIRPATAALQHVNDSTNDATIILSLDTTYISRQMRFDPMPLLVAQPKQIPAHDPNPSPKRISIVLSDRKN